jgi:WD40 repeat protein
MNRHFIALGLALAVVTALMPRAGASPDSTWSEWSIPENLGAGINTPYADASPAISRDGLTLYFNSTRPGVPPDAFGDADLYVAKRERVDLPWNEPVNLGDKINTAAFEGFAALSRNEHHLFFVRPPGDIWVSYRKNVHIDVGDSGWEAPVPLGPGVNTSNPEQGPAYFENRRLGLPQLFFHSVRPGSALVDIYVADAFGSAVPVNELNSTGVDARPSITADGLEIFFHSNRTGSAGFDMYSSVRKTVLDSWSPPRSLGNIVNSTASDFLGYISPDGETLFFSSNRDGGFGSTDIYMTTRSKH